MARPTDSNSPYRVSIHHNNGYHYASTQPARVNPKTGKREYRHVYWGTVTDDLKFIPGRTIFWSQSRNEASLPSRRAGIYEIDKLSGRRKTGRPVIESQDENRLYGDIWLLEKIAEQTGLRFDLMSTFDGDKEKVDTSATLALYLLCGRETYNQLASWQRIAKTLRKATFLRILPGLPSPLQSRIAWRSCVCGHADSTTMRFVLSTPQAVPATDTRWRISITGGTKNICPFHRPWK